MVCGYFFPHHLPVRMRKIFEKEVLIKCVEIDETPALPVIKESNIALKQIPIGLPHAFEYFLEIAVVEMIHVIREGLAVRIPPTYALPIRPLSPWCQVPGPQIDL